MNREATGLAGARHTHYETLGSTNAEALALARAGERGPLWITAAAPDRRPRPARQCLGLSAGQSLRHAAHDRAGAARSRRRSSRSSRRWRCTTPSRALRRSLGPCSRSNGRTICCSGGAKLAGILIEGESEPVFAVAIGIGVNCASHPDRHSLSRHRSGQRRRAGVAGRSVRRACRRRWRAGSDQWRRGEGFAAIRADWLKRAAGLGHDIRVRLPEREFSGRFEGLDEAGRLLVAGAAGVTVVTAGEVFPSVLPPAAGKKRTA